MNNFIKIKSLICEAKSIKNVDYFLKTMARGGGYKSDMFNFNPYLPHYALELTTRRIGVRVLLVRM